MTTPAIIVYKYTRDDRLEPVPLAQPVARLDEVSAWLPGGLYTTFRTYDHGRRVLGLDSHLARLAQADLADLVGNARLRSLLGLALQKLCDQVGAPEVRVRLSVDQAEQPGTLYLAAEPVQPIPPEVYSEGVCLASSRLKREHPELKQTDFILQSKTERQSMPPGVYELLLLDEGGAILEGMTSNFYGVRQGTLFTAGTGILAGVTRQVVLKIAQAEGIPLVLQPVSLAELDSLDEAFITSSSRGVVPAVQIDAARIGSGRPGPLSRRLGLLYERAVLDLAERIEA